jgi:hypothetical protein
MQVSLTPKFSARLREDLQLDSAAGHKPQGGGNTYELERAITHYEPPSPDRAELYGDADPRSDPPRAAGYTP